MATLLLVVAVAAASLVSTGMRRVANSRGGSSVTTAPGPDALLPSTPAALLVTTDQGRATGMVVMSIGASGRGGWAIDVPITTLAPAPGGDGEATFADTFAAGGLPFVQQAAEALLLVTFARAEALGGADLAALLEPYTSVTVELPDDVRGTDASGRPVVVARAGSQELDAERAAKVLAARGPTEAAEAVSARRVLVWRALLGNAPTGASESGAAQVSAPAATGTVDPPPDVAGFASAISSGSATVTSIQVEPETTLDGTETVRANIGALRLLLAEAMPGSVSSVSAGARVRVVDTVGDPVVTRYAVDQIVFSGANLVMVTHPSGGSAPATSLAFASPVGQEASAAIGGLFGLGSAAAATEIVDGIDLTITLGDDYATMVRQRLRTTTTTVPSATSTTRN